MPYFGEISNQVFRVLTTDDTLQYVYKHPLIEECKIYAEDGSYDVDSNCLDEIHVNYLINLLKGKDSLISGLSASTSNKVTNPTIHYLVNLLVFVCILIYTAYVYKAGRKVPDLNPFLNSTIGSLPGYRTYFTILEEGIVPSTSTPSRGSPSFSNRQKMTTQSTPQSPISTNTPEQLLGRGKFGSKVVRGLYERTEECAVKVIQDTSSWVDREIDIMRINLPYKIQYRAYMKMNNKTFICMELAFANLHEWFEIGEHRSNMHLSEREICKQIVKGVKELHQLEIAHGDLNPKNILATVTNCKTVFKIADFGLSCRRGNPHDLGEYIKRMDCEFWYAPEILESNYFEFENFIKADIYSLGCMIAYVMSQGRYHKPIDFLRSLELLREELFGHTHRVEYAQAQALRFLDLVVCMIAPNPRDRPSIEGVANYPALWDEGKSRNFMVAVFGFMKISENLGKPHPDIRKKKSRNTGFKKRSSPKQREPIEREEPIDNDRDEDPLEKPVIISLEGLSNHQKNSLHLREAVRDYGRLPLNYNYKCPVSLIKLFRNLHSHFQENKSKMERIIGNNENELERFFASYFPLLLPIVYKEAQEFKSSFDPQAEFFNPKEKMNLHQDGTLGAITGFFDDDWDLWSDEDREVAERAVWDMLDNRVGWADLSRA